VRPYARHSAKTSRPNEFSQTRCEGAGKIDAKLRRAGERTRTGEPPRMKIRRRRALRIVILAPALGAALCLAASAVAATGLAPSQPASHGSPTPASTTTPLEVPTSPQHPAPQGSRTPETAGTAAPGSASSPSPSPGIPEPSVSITPQRGLPSVASILERHRMALGRLPSLVARWSGSIVDNDQSAHYEITAARDGRFRRTYMLTLTQFSDGSNGKLDWLQDENGNVQTAPAVHHPSMDSRLVRLNDLSLPPQAAELLGTATINGRRTYAVRAVLRGTPLIIYFDAQTALVDGVDFGRHTVRYTSYQRFDGVAVPSAIAETEPGENVALTVDHVTFLHGPVNFDPPAQREPTFPAGVKTVTLSFSSPDGLIVCPVRVNGQLAHFILDTGSTTSIIDQSAAARLHLTTGGASRVQGVALMTGTLARIDELDIGGIVFSPFIVQDVPLQLPPRLAHQGIDGVLGFDLFAPLVARIAYDRDEIQLTQPADFTYTGTGAVIPIDTSQRLPTLHASIGEDDPVVLLLDTGSSAKLVLNPSFASTHQADFLETFGAMTNFAAGAGGVVPTRVYLVDRLTLGKFSLGNVDTEVIMHPEGAFGSGQVDGSLGSGALAEFAAVFLDYPDNRLILER
jgi:hypothetical protein